MPIDTSFYAQRPAPPPNPFVLLSQVLNALPMGGTRRERPPRGGLGPLADLYYLSQLVSPPAPYGWMSPWIRTPGSPAGAPPVSSPPSVAMPYGWMSPWIRTPRDR
jgi:hypothetical protein